ncbi:MAG: PVC-type heme-binding CxxCH protein [Planctomycetota bacterium]|jgi:putative heme-binding domain-containing protein
MALLVAALLELPARAEAPAQDSRIFLSTVRPTDPLAPEDELRSMSVPDGFEVQLVAAEPDIAKPMNLAFDVRGRLWVTDSVEYPIAAPPDRAGRDTIKVIDDSDGDGRLDRVTTFADGLNIPIGLYPYRDGVVCFSIPDILFLRDTDGDGRADRREKLVGPFDTTRDTHGMCNAFTRGLDGWLYACHGFNNQSQVSGRDGNVVTMHSGNTFRIRLDGARIEHHTHGQVNPFGMAFNANGDLFSADCHTKPVTLLLAGGYYESFGKPHDGLGYVPAVMDHLHGSTAIGGICLIEDERWPDEFQGNTFGGNVMTSRVNRNSLVYSGSSVRAQAEKDFLVSTDPWFRPVDLQPGPDGALYIADFYNRIIGHYEVPLDHPGRDRHRGRIWRVVPRGEHRPSVSDLTTLSVSELIGELSESNLTRRTLITDRLSDHFGQRAVTPARRAFLDSAAPNVARIHCLWVLNRLGEATIADVTTAVAADSPDQLRIHGYRVLSATSANANDQTVRQVLRAGFSDSAPLVRRAAVMASARHPHPENIPALFALHSQTPEADVHLRHAVRMALRNSLLDADGFVMLETLSLDQRAKQLVADVCLALDHAAAGAFLLRHVTDVEIADRERLQSILRQIATTVADDQLADVVKLVQQRFADDTAFQLDLLAAIRKGLDERGVTALSVQVWAARLARQLLHLEVGPEDEPLPWTYLVHPDVPGSENPWVVGNRRHSQDGQRSSVLFSSFPKGERQTGVYRSAVFTAQDSFSFWVAGHDGYPDKPANGRNLIRMRDAQTADVLFSASPPRNDIAHKTVWDTSEHTGRQVVVELVDGDSAGAYAWLAVGRFSEPRLNPDRVPEHRRQAASVIMRFRLSELVDDVRKLLSQTSDRGETARLLGMAIGMFAEDSRMLAVANAINLLGASAESQQLAVDILVNDETARVSELLKSAMKVASGAEQQRMAELLVVDQSAMNELIRLIETGAASARLLTRPAISQKIAAAATDAQKDRVAELTERLPSEDAGLTVLIQQRRKSLATVKGSAESGAAIFRKSCAVCHQVGGQGRKVGPNLDGIGTRGVDRLVEDVLAPNRNVDVAFRSTTIVTVEGKVVSGLIKRTEGEQVILVNTKGEEVSLAKKIIDEQFPSALSPMPANFGESLSEDDFYHVMAYLLSLRAR